jgi:hypothetical protein
MRTYLAVLASGVILSTISPSAPIQSVEPQKLSIPEYSLSFDRISYEIIEATKYEKNEMMSDEELISVLSQAGFSGYALKYAWAIVVKESTKRPMALNKPTNCYGLFQINMTGSMGPARREKYGLSSNDDLFNPLVNATVAYKMSNGGKNWSAWSTEKSALSIISEFPN